MLFHDKRVLKLRSNPPRTHVFKRFDEVLLVPCKVDQYAKLGRQSVVKAVATTFSPPHSVMISLMILRRVIGDTLHASR